MTWAASTPQDRAQPPKAQPRTHSQPAWAYRPSAQSPTDSDSVSPRYPKLKGQSHGRFREEVSDNNFGLATLHVAEQLRVPLVLEIHEWDQFDGAHGEVFVLVFVLVFEAEGGMFGLISVSFGSSYQEQAKKTQKSWVRALARRSNGMQWPAGNDTSSAKGLLGFSIIQLVQRNQRFWYWADQYSATSLRLRAIQYSHQKKLRAPSTPAMARETRLVTTMRRNYLSFGQSLVRYQPRKPPPMKPQIGRRQPRQASVRSASLLQRVGPCKPLALYSIEKIVIQVSVKCMQHIIYIDHYFRSCRKAIFAFSGQFNMNLRYQFKAKLLVSAIFLEVSTQATPFQILPSRTPALPSSHRTSPLLLSPPRNSPPNRLYSCPTRQNICNFINNVQCPQRKYNQPMKATALQLLLVATALTLTSSQLPSLTTVEPTLPSLQTSLYGVIMPAKWTRYNPITFSLASATPAPPSPPTADTTSPSLLSLLSPSGSADLHFLYNRVNTPRKANLLLLRLYDSKYIDGPYSELRLPLENYDEGLRQWKGEAVAEISMHKNWRKVGWLNKTVNYLVREREVDIQITPVQGLYLRQNLEFTIEYFPIFYITLLCLSAVLVELTGQATARKLPGLPAGILAIKLLGRIVVCLTASFSARQPYGGLLVLTAVVTALLMVRYLDKFSRAVNERQSRGRCSLMVLVLFLEVLFAYDWEYNLVASLLPLLLVISPATKPQTCFLCVFLTQHSLPFYYTLTDDNIFRVRPHPSAALAMLSLILLQLTVLKLRQYRVAISRLLRRRQKVDIANQQCPICLQQLTLPVLTTDCRHTFHEECLERWVQVNSVCPLDRKTVQVQTLL